MFGARHLNKSSYQSITRLVTFNPTFRFSRNFSSASANMVLKVGDPIPSAMVQEGSPGNRFDLAEKLKEGKGLIIGVPAAFSTSLSSDPVV